MIVRVIRALVVAAAMLVAGTLPSAAQIRPDSLRAGADTLRLGGGQGADSVVVYSARDSIELSVDQRILRLWGDAEVTRGAMRLTAHYIEIDLRTSELLARAAYDSTTRQYTGVPAFRDASQEFSALSMRYNFETGRGITEAAETRVDEGFYFGERIKRVSDNTLFIENGVYTTCDAPHPHYFFKAAEMKAIVGDRYFLDQPTLNVSDVPIFWIPIGVFFAPRGGKQSGLIIPTWSQNAQRGFTIEGLGYFWAGNEYVDAQLTADLYSKGGYTLHGSGRFRLRGSIEAADLDYTFGRTRDDPDQELATSHVLSYRHSQRIGRSTRLGGNLNFSTQNALRQTASNFGRLDRIEDVITRRLISNFSYQTDWRWGGSLSAQFSRHQDVVTNELLPQSATVSFRVPNWTPFGRRSAEPGIFDNVTLSYAANANWSETRRDTLPGGGFRIHTTARGISHQPQINLALPRIGYFTITPSVSVNGAWYFRRTVKNRVGDSLQLSYVPGFYQAWTGSAAVDVSTTLYGIVQPRLLGLNAIRHVLRPTLQYRWQPDFADPSFRYFDSVYDPSVARTVAYSIFEGDAAAVGPPGRGRLSQLSFGLDNVFEAKIARGDTIEDKRVRLLTASLRGSYNGAADSLRLSALTLNAATDLGPVTLNANASFDPYTTDSLGVRINQFAFDRDRTLARVTQLEVSASLSLSDQGLGTTMPTPGRSDTVASRRSRFEFEPIEFDEEEFFGDRVVGAGDYRIPWTLNMSARFSQSRQRTTLVRNASLAVNLGVQLTPTTRLTAATSYDLVAGEIAAPQISLYKDLHCWEMSFDWTPSGYAEGFYFRLGIKSPQLRDIQLERQGYR